MRIALAFALVLTAGLAHAEGEPVEDEPLPKATEDLSAPAPSLPADTQSDLDPAEPPPPPPAAAPSSAVSDEPTAADAEGAPLPGEESGRTDEPAGDSLLRDVGQAVLTVPRIAVETALAPVRTGIWMYDRYRLSERFSQAFFDKTDTYGLYPTASFDSVYGINLGARVVHRDLFGAREKFQVRGTTGGQFRSSIDGSVRSGTRFGSRTVLELRSEYERRPGDRFFGIGNNDDATETLYREELKRFTAYFDVGLAQRLMLRTTGSITERSFKGTMDPNSIETAYDTTTLTGFSPGIENMYGELEVRWDRRGRYSSPGRHYVYDSGFMLSAFGGRAHQLGMTGGNYWRYGGQAQHFLGLGANPRFLMTRLHVESVTGGLSEVAFNQLPALGGNALLRGYAPTRFRDRAAVVGTLEYFWGLGPMFLASVFVDAGRVYPSFTDLSTNGMRVGFGASLQLHEGRRFLSGVTFASSIDGGIFANLTFDPVFDHDPRAERR